MLLDLVLNFIRLKVQSTNKLADLRHLELPNINEENITNLVNRILQEKEQNLIKNQCFLFYIRFLYSFTHVLKHTYMCIHTQRSITLHLQCKFCTKAIHCAH